MKVLATGLLLMRPKCDFHAPTRWDEWSNDSAGAEIILGPAIFDSCFHITPMEDWDNVTELPFQLLKKDNFLEVSNKCHALML